MALLRPLVMGLSLHVKICVFVAAHIGYLPSIKGSAEHHEICNLFKMEPQIDQIT